MVSVARTIGLNVISCRRVDSIAKQSPIHGMSSATFCARARKRSAIDTIKLGNSARVARFSMQTKSFAIASITNRSRRASGDVFRMMDMDIKIIR